jgi:hypothetical protein
LGVFFLWKLFTTTIGGIMGKKKRRMFSAKFKHVRERWARAKERTLTKEPIPEPIEKKFIELQEEPKIVEVEKPKPTLKKKAAPKAKAKTKKTVAKKTTAKPKTKKATAKKSTRKKK